MSYTKSMKHANNHRKDKYFQPIFGMPFKEGEHVESSLKIGLRTAESFHVRAKINDKWEQISENFPTEDEAIEKSFELDKIYNNCTRIYSDKGIHISGW